MAQTAGLLVSEIYDFKELVVLAKFTKLSFNTLLVGHGDPLEGGADSAMAALAASF